MNCGISVRRYVGSSNVNIVASVGGEPDAPPVVLLHGGGQTRHSWAAAMNELVAHGYFVVNFDARGHGDSDWAPDGDYSLEAMAADLALVVGSVSSRPALVGASMGGATALFLAGSPLGPICSALVLVDVVPRIDPGGAAKILAFMRGYPKGFATLGEAANAVAAYNPHRPRAKDAAGLAKNLRTKPDGRLYWHWDPRVLTGRAEPPALSDRLNEAATRVRIPTLLVRGLRSDVVTDVGVEDFKRYMPHLEVFDVPNAGHMVAGDQNDAFNRGVIDFLAQHASSRLRS
jgi:pimeloyl-ACP methyl ester carboxylesterase